ncbi:MAG: NAD(P)/FAD-dependent oxidoreductase, partial [Gammaproteobacteria bacterium]
MQQYDVIIVGGGPAGSSLAWRLRDSGLGTIILDKKDFPRDKTCAGWITPAIIDALGLDTGDYAKKHVFQPIEGFRVGHMSDRTVEVEYEQAPVSYGIRRCEFDHYLLQRCGAETRLQYSVNSIARDGGEWIINDKMKAPLLIGAGGNFCPVARELGAKLGKAETAVRAQEFEYEMNASQAAQCRVRGTTPELYFCEDLKGYGWAFRKGNWLNVGLGREDNHGLPQHAREFCRFLKDQGRIPEDIPEKMNGHAYLLYQHAGRPLYADGALLIGDSAGLAYTQSGEGIRPAIESALMAADVIVKAAGDYSTSRLAPYENHIIERFGQRDGSEPLLSRIVPLPVKKLIAHKLLETNWFVREVVIGKWFLHQGESA